MPLTDLATLGYAVVADALSLTTVDRLRAAFSPRGRAEATGSTEHVRITDETPHAEAWRALGEHSIVREAAQIVFGEGAASARGFHVRDAHGRNPLAGAGAQGLHADARPRGPGDPFTTLTLLWMLDDFRVENGATRIVPRSHVWTQALPKALLQPTVKHPDELVVTGSVGSVLVFNGHLLHAGRRNESGEARRTVQMLVERGAAPEQGFLRRA